MADHPRHDDTHEGFLQRWARRKEEAARASEHADVSPVAGSSAEVHDDISHPTPADARAAPADAPAPTLTSADVAALAPDSSYAPFMARGVDKAVQRLAMKKLFSDPHFQALDGLDIYMGDYNVASPVSAGMLASLQHAQGMLARGAELAERLAEAERLAQSANAPAVAAVSTNDGAAAVAVSPGPPPISEGDA